MKKFLAIVLMLMLVVSAAASAEVLQIGFENSMSEPIGQALEKWQELLARLPAGQQDRHHRPDAAGRARHDPG